MFHDKIYLIFSPPQALYDSPLPLPPPPLGGLLVVNFLNSFFMATTDSPIVPLDNVSYVYLCLPILLMIIWLRYCRLTILTCEDIKGLVRRSLLKSGPLLTAPIIKNSTNCRALFFTKFQFEGFVSFRIFRSTLYKNKAHNSFLH